MDDKGLSLLSRVPWVLLALSLEGRQARWRERGSDQYANDVLVPPCPDNLPRRTLDPVLPDREHTQMCRLGIDNSAASLVSGYCILFTGSLWSMSSGGSELTVAKISDDFFEFLSEWTKILCGSMSGGKGLLSK